MRRDHQRILPHKCSGVTSVTYSCCAFCSQKLTLFLVSVVQSGAAKRHLPDIEKWLQRHPEAGSAWPSWPMSS